jgi:hypothetical protein
MPRLGDLLRPRRPPEGVRSSVPHRGAGGGRGGAANGLRAFRPVRARIESPVCPGPAPEQGRHRDIEDRFAPEHPAVRARQRARPDEQGDARPLHRSRDRCEEPLVEHRRGPSRPRPPQGRPARTAPRSAARGAGEVGTRQEERGGRAHPGRAGRGSGRRRRAAGAGRGARRRGRGGDAGGRRDRSARTACDAECSGRAARRGRDRRAASRIRRHRPCRCTGPIRCRPVERYAAGPFGAA